MTLQCSICLCSFKDPVCLPCGHIYCKKCLSDHVNVPSNTGMTSTCPECRTTFHIAVPDLTYLPTKYHPFITTAVRRVFIDTSGYAQMQKQVRQMEKQIAHMKSKEETQVQQNEQLANSLIRAKEKIRDLEKTTKVYHNTQLALEDKVETLTCRYSGKKLEYKNLLERTRDLEKQLERSESPSFSDLSPFSSPQTSRQPYTPKVIPRAIKPLPRRHQIQRRVREDNDSPPQNFIHSKRPRLSDLS